MGRFLEPEYVGNKGAPTNNLETLPQKQQIAIILIKRPEDIKTISEIKTWIDDREVCVSAKINGIELPFWWAGPALVGHFMYGNFIPEAKQQIFEWLQEKINTTYDEDEKFSMLVDKIKENEQMKANVGAKTGPEFASTFNKFVDNIL
jgi:hypothetical protein